MSDSTDQTPEQIMQALAAPFEATEIKWKPGVIQGNRAMALAYVDARVVQDRLDEVLGVAGWQDDYRFLKDGSVFCRLRVRVGGEWLTKSDVGGESEQPDGGDRKKAAVSDALKRAAVKFGIGRTLYRLPRQWVDFDPVKKQMKPPQLPDWYVNSAGPPTPAPAKKAAPKPEPAAKEPPAPAPKAPANLPKDGAELDRRIRKFDADLAAKGRCQPGDLVRVIESFAKRNGFPPRMTEMDDGKAILWAVEEAKAFEAKLPKAAGPDAPDRETPRPHGKIGPEQVKALERAADEAGVFWPDVAAKYRKVKLEDLTYEEYLHAVSSLERQAAVTA